MAQATGNIDQIATILKPVKTVRKRQLKLDQAATGIAQQAASEIVSAYEKLRDQRAKAVARLALRNFHPGKSAKNNTEVVLVPEADTFIEKIVMFEKELKDGLVVQVNATDQSSEIWQASDLEYHCDGAYDGKDNIHAPPHVLGIITQDGEEKKKVDLTRVLHAYYSPDELLIAGPPKQKELLVGKETVMAKVEAWCEGRTEEKAPQRVLDICVALGKREIDIATLSPIVREYIAARRQTYIDELIAELEDLGAFPRAISREYEMKRSQRYHQILEKLMYLNISKEEIISEIVAHVQKRGNETKEIIEKLLATVEPSMKG